MACTPLYANMASTPPGLPKPLTDLVEDENPDVSNNKDQVKSKDESGDEDKAIYFIAVSMKAGMKGSHPVTFTG